MKNEHFTRILMYINYYISFSYSYNDLLGITKLDKEKNQCIRETKGAQNIVEEI